MGITEEMDRKQDLDKESQVSNRTERPLAFIRDMCDSM